MGSPLLWTVAAVAVFALLGSLVLGAQVRRLRTRLDEVSRRLADAERSAVAEPNAPRSSPGYLITSAVPDPDTSPVAASSRGTERDDDPRLAVVSLPPVLVEPVVRLAAVAYGARQALSPESRNRIRFAMRQELKRARKQRRRDLREARRSPVPSPRTEQPPRTQPSPPAEAAGRDEVAA
jgi:hypothetical protein